MSPDFDNAVTVHSVVHTEPGRGSGLFALVRVVLLLVLWVCAFVAFLVAPLLVLVLAWIIGVAWVAYRHRGRNDHPALESGPTAGAAHAFGAAFPGHTEKDGPRA